MDRVSCIVLTRDQWPYTRACLGSLLSTRGVELEVVVVDNGSTDGTPDRVRAMKPEFEARGMVLHLHVNATNVGCSTARNQGLEMAYGNYCAFMDNDVMACGPDWAADLIRSLCEQGAALVGPKLIYPVPPHLIQCAGVGISRTGRVQFRGRGRPRDDREFSRRCECQALISACLLFPYGLFEEIGGLDEAFNPIQYEDLDFCYRARARGFKAVYEPSVEVYHWESITSEASRRLPNTYLIVKHGMLFKERWRHMFENEDGPSDESCRWARITLPSFDGPREP